MENKQKWVLPVSTRKMSEVCVSPQNSSGKRKSSNFKQYTQIVEKTTSFKLEQEKFHEDPLPSPSFRSFFDFDLSVPKEPDSGTLVWMSEGHKARKRRSIREMGIDVSMRPTFSHNMPSENVREADRPKTTDNLNLILNVLKNHFIFFFSKVQSCKR